MRFVYDHSAGMLIPDIIERTAEAAAEATINAFTDLALIWFEAAGKWFIKSGIPLIAEGLLLWGMVCILIGCTGSGAWLGKGAKIVVISIMVGLLQYAI